MAQGAISQDIHIASFTCSPICTATTFIGLNSQKRVTHSIIKVLHHPTSLECITALYMALVEN